MRDSIRSFVRGEDAATAVEYAVMLALILLVTFAGITAVGNTNQENWQDIESELSDHNALGRGDRMEKVTTKKLALYSGRTHPAVAEDVAQGLEYGAAAGGAG